MLPPKAIPQIHGPMVYKRAKTVLWNELYWDSIGGKYGFSLGIGVLYRSLSVGDVDSFASGGRYLS